MSGNRIERNIFAYRGAKSDLFAVRNFPVDRNVVNKNLVWPKGGPIRTGFRPEKMLDEWAAWLNKGMDRQSVVGDPKFVDSRSDNPALAVDSPALRLGFESIRWNRIGPYMDERRASWPIQQAPGAREWPVRLPEE